MQNTAVIWNIASIQFRSVELSSVQFVRYEHALSDLVTINVIVRRAAFTSRLLGHKSPVIQSLRYYTLLAPHINSKRYIPSMPIDMWGYYNNLNLSN